MNRVEEFLERICYFGTLAVGPDGRITSLHTSDAMTAYYVNVPGVTYPLLIKPETWSKQKPAAIFARIQAFLSNQNPQETATRLINSIINLYRTDKKPTNAIALLQTIFGFKDKTKKAEIAQLLTKAWPKRQAAFIKPREFVLLERQFWVFIM